MAKRIDILTLTAGHSLIIGHKPLKLDNERLAQHLEEIKSDTLNFGLFDSSAPNYTTYYPDLKTEDLNPKDEEFVFPVYRMLSEVVVAKKRNPVDFSKKGVLKNSMSLLKGATVNVDHEMAVGNAIGSVFDVFWQNAYTTAEGKKIPAGINAVLKIDGKSNPRLARGIMMDPPSIHSNSVTVQFEWEKSHPKMEDDEFREKLGRLDDRGELVRRIATNIAMYYETSLVSAGQDPYAQKIGTNGKILNPLWADTRANLKESIPKNIYVYDWKTYNDQVSLSEETEITENLKNDNMLDLKSLIALLGFTPTDNINTEEELKTAVLGLKTQVSTIEGLNAKITDLTTKNGDLTTQLTDKTTELATKVTELGKFSKTGPLGEKYLSDLRLSVINQYKAINGDKADTTQIENLEKMSDVPTLEALKKTYDEDFDKKCPLQCKCGSHDISRKSSVSQQKVETGDIKSNKEVKDSLTKDFKTSSYIFSDPKEKK